MEMKRYLLAALVGLMVTPGVASAQMMGWNGNATTQTVARHEMRPQTQTAGMMVQDADTTGDCMMDGGVTESGTGTPMPGGSMGYNMWAATMSPMGGMMYGRNLGPMMVADGMMNGQVDFGRMRQALTLSDVQAERLKADLRPFQKEAILTLASLNVAELELADLLAAEKVDIGKVEAKLKEIEGVRAKARLTQINAAVAVQGILGTEQLAMLHGTGGCHSTLSEPTAEQGDVTPQGESGHHMHH